jgi:hypothetical protein
VRGSSCHRIVLPGVVCIEHACGYDGVSVDRKFKEMVNLVHAHKVRFRFKKPGSHAEELNLIDNLSYRRVTTNNRPEEGRHVA